MFRLNSCTTLRYRWVSCYSCSHLLICIQCLLDDIRAHRIPVDFLDLFDAVKVPFYDGWLMLVYLCSNANRRTTRMYDCGAFGL